MNDEQILQQQEMQELKQGLLHMQQQLQLLAHQLQELEQVKEAIVSLGKANKGDEILVPLDAGVYSQATVTNTKDVLMNVGANTIVTKKIDDARILVDSQIAELQKIQKDMEEEFSHVSQQMQMAQMTQRNSEEKEE